MNGMTFAFVCAQSFISTFIGYGFVVAFASSVPNNCASILFVWTYYQCSVITLMALGHNFV